MTTTDRDIHDQVQQAVDASEGAYDVDAITRAIVDRYGLVSIEDIDHDAFWALVGEFPVDPAAVARLDALDAFKRQMTTLPGEPFTTWRGDTVVDTDA